MKRRHKQVAGGAAILVTALAGFLATVDKFITHRHEDATILSRANSRIQELEREVCALRGGRWYRGDCLENLP